MNKLLSVRDVTIKYGRHIALENISFDVFKGDYIGIVGPNGSGKSTLLRAILGLIKNDTGTIEYNDKIMSKDVQRGYLPQKSISSDIIFPATVGEIISTGLPYKSRKNIFNTFNYIINKKSNNEIDRILEKLGIQELKNTRIGNLSGGQHQRVLLARALIGNPLILFLDEPTSALDPSIREEFFNLISDLNRNDGVTIMLVSHDISTIGKYTNKLMYLDTSLVFYGTYDEFCNSPDMTNYFGYNSQHQICWRHENGKCFYHDS